MELESLKNSLNKIREEFNQVKENASALQVEVKLIDAGISQDLITKKELENNISLYETSKQTVNKIILATRNEAIAFIENIVNCALLDVFQNPKLKLKLELNTEGAKTSISTYIEEDGELYDIESGRGGGLRDLVSTAILICCRALVRPKIELPLLLDESFKFLHSTKDNAFKTNAFKFLKEVANKLGMQIILITGEEEKNAIENADNVLYIAKKDNESYLQESEYNIVDG